MLQQSSRLFSFSALIVALAISLPFLSFACAQGVSKTGMIDGKAFYSAAKILNTGHYTFQAYGTKNKLTLISSDNILAPAASGNNQWEIKKHGTTKYFTMRGFNNAGLSKCVSTRWAFAKPAGYPDAAVMWQCEVDTDKPLYYGYDPIYPPKQMWLTVPDQHHNGYIKLVSGSHLYDMIPRCITPDHITGGIRLKKCLVNTNDTSLLWKVATIKG
ncbi:hypothetical protein BDF14DRAFT_1879713 [Spinellus fusiger]|nr:hypothetical protein BDF14DRAFT_1879713 [Spinellus fusiger]